ncbi:MAG: hypothetical protein OXC26_21095 [Albidovulum sp.]|nr:hypothetical protein [Albidovulum sp.]
MTNTTLIRQRSPQEIEIDHLLAEEFYCDPDFSARFAAACGLQFDTFRVIRVTPEPSLGGEGYGDLLVEANMDGQRAALLIEDKITASAATRQAERYAAYAERMLQEDWDSVVTVLVAPRSYQGERARYDASVDLEVVTEMLHSPDERRQNYRRSIIAEALRKKAATGVQNPDPAMLRLHSDYLQWVGERFAGKDLPYSFPPLKESYYNGDNWIEWVRHPDFPAHVWLRHRLWTTVKDTAGMVDLIISPSSEDEGSRLKNVVPDWAVLDSYGKAGQGLKFSVRVPEMRQSTGFCEVVAGKAFAAMEQLTDFFLQLEIR